MQLRYYNRNIWVYAKYCFNIIRHNTFASIYVKMFWWLENRLNLNSDVKTVHGSVMIQVCELHVTNYLLLHLNILMHDINSYILELKGWRLPDADFIARSKDQWIGSEVVYIMQPLKEYIYLFKCQKLFNASGTRPLWFPFKNEEMRGCVFVNILYSAVAQFSSLKKQMIKKHPCT